MSKQKKGLGALSGIRTMLPKSEKTRLKENEEKLDELQVDKNAYPKEGGSSITLDLEWIKETLIDEIDANSTLFDVIQSRDESGISGAPKRRQLSEEEQNLFEKLIFSNDAKVSYKINNRLEITFSSDSYTKTQDFIETLTDLNYNNETMMNLRNIALLGASLDSITLYDEDGEVKEKNEFKEKKPKEVMDFLKNTNSMILNHYVSLYTKFSHKMGRILSASKIESF